MNKMGGRNRGIDLLKILLALLIVANHSIGHGIKELIPDFYEENYVLLSCITVLANPAVNCFYLISGYFGIRRSKSGFIKLMIPVVTVSIFLAIGEHLLHYGGIGTLIRTVLFPWMNWWFVAVYMIIWMLSPYINIMLDHMDMKSIQNLSLLLIVICAIQGFLFSGGFWGSGFSVAQAVTMYITGDWLNKINLTEPRKSGAMLWVSMTCLMIIIVIGIDYLNINAWAERIYSYSNPVVICQSIALVVIFANIKAECMAGSLLQQSSQAVLTIYLITDSALAQRFIYIPMSNCIRKNGWITVTILANALIMFAIAYVVQSVFILEIKLCSKLDEKVLHGDNIIHVKRKERSKETSYEKSSID